MGELGNACAEFLPVPNADPDEKWGTIYDDGFGEYCNGTDGQVSIPTRFRMDSKKWNKEGRKYFVDAVCLEPESEQQPTLCDGAAEISAIQSQIKYNCVEVCSGTPLQCECRWDLAGADVELHFQEMTPNEVARVSMSVLVGKQRHLHFGDDQDFSRAKCPPGENDVVYGEPVWVRCDSNTNPEDDELCDRWTVSTFKLQPGSPGIDFELSAHACLIEGVSGVPTWENVQADFILDVCVLGVSCE